MTPLNTEVTLTVKANSFLNPIAPSQGVIVLGNNGLEFLASNGNGFIQIPWKNIQLVKAHVFFGGRYIRGFDIVTDEDKLLSFVVAHGLETLQVMRHHLGSQKMVRNSSNFKKLFKKKQK